LSTPQDIVERILSQPTRLSIDQKEAVLSKARYNRVIAGAGAGKTETLTRRIAYLVLAQDVPPSSIVAFTFTEQAARSMKSRIYQRVTELKPGKLNSLGEMYIGTIHAYAKRILDDHFRYGNYSVLDENEEMAFLMRHGWGLNLREYHSNYSESCRVFSRTVNMVWDEMLNRQKLQETVPSFHDRLIRYENLLDRHKLLTFGRMIYSAVLRLKEAPDTLSYVKHLVVDEYQDINRAQEELIGLVGSHGEIFVVGDPRQSIYQWRGSDERFFESFSNRFKEARDVTIRENRRSSKRIVANANKFAGTFQRTYEPMQSTKPEEGFIGTVCQASPVFEAKWIADQIEDLTGRRGLKYSDIGILTRSVSLAAGPLVDELKARRIPYIVGGKVGLFKRDEAKALGCIFSWFCENGFWVENPWKWNEKMDGDVLIKEALQFWRVAYHHTFPEDAETRLRKIKADLNSTHSSYRNFTAIYHDVLSVLGFRELDHEDPNDAAMMANLGRFHNLLTDFESANRIGGRTPHWKQDLWNLCWFMNSYASQAYEEQPSDNIRGINAVQIMTIHQAKGLEWPVVVLFSTVKNRFPPRSLGRTQDWCNVPRDMFDAERYEGSEEDERRLFYVAVTRARDVLIISYFAQRNGQVKRSPFIEDMDLRVATRLQPVALPPIQIGPAQISDEMLTFSASEITAYVRCPYMYLLREVYGYQPQLNEAIGYGKGVHFCLRRAIELVKRTGQDPIAAAGDAIDMDFFMPYAGGQVLENFKRGARAAVMLYARNYAVALGESSEAEYRIEFPIHDATVMGRIDVAENREVRDYKTSQDYVEPDEVAMQIKIYAAGLRRLGRQIEKGSVAYLSSENVKIEPIDVSEPAVECAVQEAEKVVKSIIDGRFAPKLGMGCQKCDQGPICRWRSRSAQNAQPALM
jgi:DNA helicase-2/ATP-dependent DNA helicase PcrA